MHPTNIEASPVHTLDRSSGSEPTGTVGAMDAHATTRPVVARNACEQLVPSRFAYAMVDSRRVPKSSPSR